MERNVPIVRLLGSSLLGVLGAAALIFAVLLFIAAWATGSAVRDWVGDVGTIAILAIAVLALAYAAAAGFAARQEWLARPSGRMIGLVVAIVAVLAAGTALLVGEVAGSEVVLYVAMGLGIATAIPLVLPEPGGATR